ncbi:hypothetical protein [Nostoc sp.]|uniref:hypothetical protein n=1 Tax=Nostoc sp. TaxID=1180 RepID=UPI002FF92E2A
MLENQNSPLILNNVDALLSANVSLPLKWKGLNVYLYTASSRYPVHEHHAIQITIALLTSGFNAVTLSATDSRQNINFFSCNIYWCISLSRGLEYNAHL